MITTADKGNSVVILPTQQYNTIQYNTIQYENTKIHRKNNLQTSTIDPTSHLATLILRVLMSYIYGAPILDVSRSHRTTQHSR